MAGEKTDDKIVMKKEELDKLIKTKTEGYVAKEDYEAKVKEIEEKYKSDFEEMKKAAAEERKKEIEKALANRKSIEETGLDYDGEEATDKQILLSKLEKSEKDGEKITDFDRALKKAHDNLVMLNHVYRAKNMTGIENTTTYKKYQNLVEKGNIFKAWDSTSGDGAEWEPTVLSSRIMEYAEAEQDYKLTDAFERITMVSKTFEMPRQDSVINSFKDSVPISISTQESTPSTDKITFSSNTLLAYSKLYYETEEDMIVSAMPFLEKALARGIARGTVDAIINGDDGTTHMDASVTDSKDRRKLFDGLRRFCQTNSYTKSIGASWSKEYLRKVFKELDPAFGLDFTNLMLILGNDGYNQILALTEVLTSDKVTPRIATILNGTLQSIYGADIRPTSLLRDDSGTSGVNSSGVVSGTAANNSKGQALLVHKNSFAFGVRRTLMLESDRNVTGQYIDVVASMRCDFQPLVDITARQPVVQAINVTPW